MIMNKCTPAGESSAGYRPIVGITMGDAAGIGPEIIIKALEQPRIHAACKPLIIGAKRVIDDAVERFATRPVKVRGISAPEDARFDQGVIEVVEVDDLDPKDYEMGRINAACGRAFVAAIRNAARFALAQRIDAIASGPTNKETMHAAGEFYPGQTELFAEETASVEFSTVLVGGPIRCFLVSTHVSLRQAIELVRRDRVESVLRQAFAALKSLWGIRNPTIAVAGLNPHAGDGGLFGTEEIEEIIPVIDELRAEGYAIVGPEPSDSLFLSADHGKFDGIVAMYHDQGVIPLKRHGYVTTIAGMPILRTTAGHGTAYNIAGKGIADSTVMEKAVLLAAELASRRRAHFSDRAD